MKENRNDTELIPHDISQDKFGTHLQWSHDGVTAKMIDWFWSNMEKGYILWHPSQHERLGWAKIPVNGNPIGSIHIAPQTWGDGIRQNLHIRMEELSSVASEIRKFIKYKHVIIVAAIGYGPQALANPQIMGYRLHQWESTDSGVVGCSSGIGVLKSETLEEGLIWAAHCREEINNWGNFLPELYTLYKVVKNPETKPFADLTVVGTGENATYKFI